MILTLNEELHIERCLSSIPNGIDRIDVLDSGSSDNTIKLCASYPKVRLIEHKWEGSHSAQIRWYLNNYGKETKFLLRLDADEYIRFSKNQNLETMLNQMTINSCRAATFRLKRVFMGGVLKFGNLPIDLIRLIETAYCNIDSRPMDEKFIVNGLVYKSRINLYDHSLITIKEWTNKHINYVNQELQVEQNGGIKRLYYSFPPILRSILYFLVRYFLFLGFLDGKRGFYWAFFQCLWYRILIDYNSEIQKQNSDS